MCYRCLRVVLWVVGCALLVAAVFPVVDLLDIPDPWATAFVASKLLMLPIGALCVFLAVGMRRKSWRR